MVGTELCMDPASRPELCGLKQIATYLGKSENSVRRLIREEDFPAVKIGGEWTSDMQEITRWRRQRIRRRHEVMD